MDKREERQRKERQWQENVDVAHGLKELESRQRERIMNKWHMKEAGREALDEPDTVSGSILGGSDEKLPLSYGIAIRWSCRS